MCSVQSVAFMNYPVDIPTYLIDPFMQDRSDEVRFIRGFAWKKEEKDFRVCIALFPCRNNETTLCRIRCI